MKRKLSDFRRAGPAAGRGGYKVLASPEHTVEMVDKAFNGGDLESVLNFYEDRAGVVTEIGKLARGKDELRRILSKQVMASKPSVRQIKTHVIEADGVALFLSRWT